MIQSNQVKMLERQKTSFYLELCAPYLSPHSMYRLQGRDDVLTMQIPCLRNFGNCGNDDAQVSAAFEAWEAITIRANCKLGRIQVEIRTQCRDLESLFHQLSKFLTQDAWPFHSNILQLVYKLIIKITML